MNSVCDTPKGGFPHSEISGSKLICQLPEAYRRLSRLSSPIIAKASTTCSYSLDPITLISLGYLQGMMSGLSPNALCRIFQFQYDSKLKVYFDAIKKITMSLAARSALNLYECAVSASNADLTL
jgi:hypothetical protein